MEDQLISFPIAKLAKELGFQAPSKLYSRLVSKDEYFWNNPKYGPIPELGTEIYIAPTQSLLQKWLREVHKIHISIKNASGFYWLEVSRQGKEYTRLPSTFYSYEEALEEGLLQGLTIIPQ